MPLWPPFILKLWCRFTIVASKCNPRPEKRFIERDVSDPTVCPIAALAFWLVLLGPHVAAGSPFFATANSGGELHGPSADEVVAPLRHYLARSGLLSPAAVDRVNLHAIRHGGASGAVLGGASREQAKCLGRWRGNSDVIYTATTKDSQGFAAANAISRALGHFTVGL